MESQSQYNRTHSGHCETLFLVCTVFFYIMFVSQSSGQVRRNLSITDSLMRVAAQQIQNNLTSTSGITSIHDTLRMQVTPHNAQWLIEQHLFALPIPLRRLQRGDSLHTFVNIRPLDFGVRYFTIENNDEMVAREVQIVLTLTTEKPDGFVVRLPSATASYRDSIYRTSVPFVESQQYEFTRGAVPEPPGTLFRSLLEPLLVVASAAVVLLLLFTVRSQ